MGVTSLDRSAAFLNKPTHPLRKTQVSSHPGHKHSPEDTSASRRPTFPLTPPDKRTRPQRAPQPARDALFALLARTEESPPGWATNLLRLLSPHPLPSFQGGFKKSLCMPRKRCRPRKDSKEPEFISEADPQHRHPTNQTKLGKGENTVSRVTVRFRCPVFNNKNHKAYKESGHYGLFILRKKAKWHKLFLRKTRGQTYWTKL